MECIETVVLGDYNGAEKFLYPVDSYLCADVIMQDIAHMFVVTLM